jgi:hypothetical protein
MVRNTYVMLRSKYFASFMVRNTYVMLRFEVLRKFYGAKYLRNVTFEVLRKFYGAKYLRNVTFEVLRKVTIHNIYVIMHSKYFEYYVRSTPKFYDLVYYNTFKSTQFRNTL